MRNSHAFPSLSATPLYTLTTYILVISYVATFQIHPDMYNSSDKLEVFKEQVNIIALEKKIINWWIIEHHQRKPNQIFRWGKELQDKRSIRKLEILKFNYQLQKLTHLSIMITSFFFFLLNSRQKLANKSQSSWFSLKITLLSSYPQSLINPSDPMDNYMNSPAALPTPGLHSSRSF